MDRRLVKIVGRAEELGRPMLYGTTKEFLTIFGLANLGDLPDVQGLAREASWKPANAEVTTEEMSETTETATEAAETEQIAE